MRASRSCAIVLSSRSPGVSKGSRETLDGAGNRAGRTPRNAGHSDGRARRWSAAGQRGRQCDARQPSGVPVVNPPAPAWVNPDASRFCGADGSGGSVRRARTGPDDCVDSAGRPPARSGAAPPLNNRGHNKSGPGRSGCTVELGHGSARRERNGPKTPSALVITPRSVGLDGVVRTLENDRAFPPTRERWGASRNETCRLRTVARPGRFGGALFTARLPSAPTVPLRLHILIHPPIRNESSFGYVRHRLCALFHRHSQWDSLQRPARLPKDRRA